MKYQFIAAVILLLLGKLSFAQGENNIWASGRYAGLDFNSGTPVFFPSQSVTGEGCATICDADGSLLFYSNGTQVWNKNHTVMPNGDSLLGNKGGWTTSGSATQGVTIVPFVADTNKYFIFTLDCNENISPEFANGYLRYSVVDMSLNNGLGDVLPGKKNIVVDSGMSEKMCVAKGSNCFFWLITHKYGTNEFKCFKITDAIVSAVSSYTSSLVTLYPRTYINGEMKISPDHKYIATTAGENNHGFEIELYSFDNKTGKVSEPYSLYTLSVQTFLYGLSFSPDGSKLYFGGQGSMNPDIPLYQIDLSLLPDVPAVRNSRVSVGEGTWGGMRMGPDGKIYITAHNSNNLHYVNKPNEKGKACEVMPLNFVIPDSVDFTMSFGSEVFSRSSLFPENGMVSDSFICKTQWQSRITLNAREGYDSYVWSNGSNGKSVNVTATGTYMVRAQNDCGIVTDTFHVYDFCDGCGYAPTAFTPNHDGRNDVFRIVGNISELVKLMIYDRWGNEVFYTTDINKEWDGTYKGKPCENGVYYYMFIVKCQGLDGMYIKKGDITLLR